MPAPVQPPWLTSRRIGIHTSTSGGPQTAAERAYRLGCNTFQIFSSSPRQWKPYDLGRTQCSEMTALRTKYDLRPLVIHSNYLINLAGGNADFHAKSIVAFRGELERAQGDRGAPDRSSWLATLRDWRERFPYRYTQEDGGPIKPQFVVERILEATHGEATIVVGAQKQRMTKGDVIVIPAAAPQTVQDVSRPMSYYLVTVPASAPSAMSSATPLTALTPFGYTLLTESSSILLTSESAPSGGSREARRRARPSARRTARRSRRE